MLLDFLDELIGNRLISGILLVVTILCVAVVLTTVAMKHALSS